MTGQQKVSHRRRSRPRERARVLVVMGDGRSERTYFQNFAGSNPSLRIKPEGTGRNGIRPV